MKNNFILHAFLIIFLFVADSLFAQPVFIKDSLDNYVKEAMNYWEVPAVSIAIVKDGKIVLLKAYGTKGIHSKELVDENTLFMIGSNTKLFTATALAIAEQEKKLSLTDKANKWLPYFKLKDTLAGRSTNIKDLLSHRLGFETFQGDFTYWNSKLSRQEVVKKMALLQAPYEFRTTWGYSNAAFVACGEILKAATGQSWENYIQSKILLPLNMNNTLMLCENIKTAKNIALPHSIINDTLKQIEYANIDNLAPAGSMSSNAKDLSNWLITQLENGSFNNKQVIASNAILTTRIPQSILGIDNKPQQQTHFYTYGLGVLITDRANKLVYNHTGGVNGFTSFIGFIPEEKLGVVVLTNTDQNNLYNDLGTQILDAYLNIPFQNYSKNSFKLYQQQLAQQKIFADSLRAIVAKKNQPPLPLDQFTGEYSNEVYGKISITKNNDHLILHFSNHAILTATLHYLKNNTFLCDYSDSIYGSALEFPFVLENGKVKEFTLSVSNFVENKTYTFTKTK